MKIMYMKRRRQIHVEVAPRRAALIYAEVMSTRTAEIVKPGEVMIDGERKAGVRETPVSKFSIKAAHHGGKMRKCEEAYCECSMAVRAATEKPVGCGARSH